MVRNSVYYTSIKSIVIITIASRNAILVFQYCHQYVGFQSSLTLDVEILIRIIVFIVNWLIITVKGISTFRLCDGLINYIVVILLYNSDIFMQLFKLNYITGLRSPSSSQFFCGFFKNILQLICNTQFFCKL